MAPEEKLTPWSLRRRRFSLAVVVLGLVVTCDFVARSFASRHDAAWIWADDDYRDGRPISFYAVRDVELPAPSPGRMTIVADETYQLYVNGQRIGAGSYEARVDVYEVGSFLDAGWNRILIELSSSRGAGGLLAQLELDDGTTVATGGSWRIFRRHQDGIVGGWSDLDNGETPKIWERTPTGRWRLHGLQHREILFQGFPPLERRPPLKHQLRHDTEWSPLEPSQRRIPALGPQQIFDWGAEVEGVLSFDLSSDNGAPGLLYVSSEVPDPTQRLPDAYIIPVPGRGWWQDAHPRRFRYALIAGVEPRSRIEVDLLETGRARADVPNHEGVFGIRPPRSYSSAEEAVWDRLTEEAVELSLSPGGGD